eukprot:996279-Pyramimonas_sp.AAC.1
MEGAIVYTRGGQDGRGPSVPGQEGQEEDPEEKITRAMRRVETDEGGALYRGPFETGLLDGGGKLPQKTL